VFLDLKFHDIPNTVAGAVREATRIGVAMLNVHASGGAAMMRAATEAATKAAKDFAVARPICLGVTVLTSLDRKGLEEVGVAGNVEAHVLRLAERAREAGLDGCVASPQEVRLLRPRAGAAVGDRDPGDSSRRACRRSATRRDGRPMRSGRAPTPSSSAVRSPPRPIPRRRRPPSCRKSPRGRLV